MTLRRNAEILMDQMYENEITNFFKKWIKNYCGIDCFAILVILPDNDMLHLSTHPPLTKIYHERQYGLYDQPIMEKYYSKLPFYPWRQLKCNKLQNEIHLIREKIFNLNSGTNFVRTIDASEGRFHIIYCISSFEKNPLNYFRFACNVNKILEVGDYCYNSLFSIFQENCEKFTLPKIEKFLGFQYENLNDLFNNYILRKNIAEKLIEFLEKSWTEDKTEYNIKTSLKLIVNNRHL